MMPQMGQGPGGPPQGPGGPPDPQKMAALMAVMQQMRGQGGPPGGGPPPMPGQGAPPMPPGAQVPPNMPMPVPSMGAPQGPPPGPPISRPGMSDMTNKGLLMMINIGQQVLQQIDPASEQADRLASILQELDEVLAQANSSGMGSRGPGMPPGGGMGPELSNMTHAQSGNNRL